MRITSNQAFAFIAAQPRTAKLGTTKKDGSPHVVPVWVEFDDGDLIFTAGGTTVKVQAMRRDPRVSMCFDDETPPFAFVTVAGVASISDDSDEMLKWATRIGGRYMGTDRGDEYGRRNSMPGEVLVRVTPTRIIGELGVSD